MDIFDLNSDSDAGTGWKERGSVTLTAHSVDTQDLTRYSKLVLHAVTRERLPERWYGVQIFVPTSATHLQSDDLDWDWA